MSILEHVHDVLAILYIGSWATQEMSYVEDRGQLRFLNDIDVLVITEHKMNSGEVKLLRDKVSRIINPDYIEYEDYVSTEGLHNLYVDIRNISQDGLRALNPRIKYYDIFNDPSVIYIKDRNVAENLPKIELENIPHTDGLTHLFNRIALLVEWHPHIVEKDITLLILILKAYIAILDALLLLAGRYVSSIKEKADVFGNIFTREFGELSDAVPDLADRVYKMIDIKINFYRYHPIYTGQDVLDIWNNARNDILVVIIYAINSIYKTRFKLAPDSGNLLELLKFLEKHNGLTVIPYIKHRVRRYGFELPAFLMPFAFIAIRYMYFSRFKEFIHSQSRYNIFFKSIASTRDPTTLLYLSAMALLAGVVYSDKEVFQDNKLIEAVNGYLDDASFIDDSKDLITRFKEAFRIWELLTFEL
jgi:hypothetical protein